MSNLVIGCDPGKRTDPAAIVLAEIEDRGGIEHYLIRLIESPDLGTSYTVIVARLAGLDRKLADRGGLEIRIEANGVGEALLDQLRRARLSGRLVAIYTTGGDRVTVRDNGRELSIGKSVLVTRLVTLLEQGRVHLPDTEEADALRGELERFGYETTAGGVKYEAQTGHDDLVMALALATWRAQRKKRAGWGWGTSKDRRGAGGEVFPGLPDGGAVTVHRPMKRA